MDISGHVKPLVLFCMHPEDSISIVQFFPQSSTVSVR